MTATRFSEHTKERDKSKRRCRGSAKSVMLEYDQRKLETLPVKERGDSITAV